MLLGIAYGGESVPAEQNHYVCSEALVGYLYRLVISPYRPNSLDLCLWQAKRMA